jgi:hemin uptake protein HemP
LLQGQKKVQILHHDQVYVLQTTRQGKLILTK